MCISWQIIPLKIDFIDWLKQVNSFNKSHSQDMAWGSNHVVHSDGATFEWGNGGDHDSQKGKNRPKILNNE